MAGARVPLTETEELTLRLQLNKVSLGIEHLKQMLLLYNVRDEELARISAEYRVAIPKLMDGLVILSAIGYVSKNRETDMAEAVCALLEDAVRSSKQ